MKNLNKIALALSASLVLMGCNKDFKDEISIDNANSFPTTVAFTSTSVSTDEDGEGADVTIELLGNALSSDLTVEYTLTENGIASGVDYTFTDGNTFVIPAGEYSASVNIAPVDNEDIASGSKSLTFTITGTSDSNVSIGTDAALGRTVTFSILDDDFFCTRNSLAAVITTATDVGYSSFAASIVPAATEAEGCLTFGIVGGAGPIFGQQIDIQAITFEEDSPGSNTGTILDQTDVVFTLPNGDVIANKIDISEGIYTGLDNYYDLTTGAFGFDYVYYNGSGVNTFNGRLEYCGNASCSVPSGIDTEVTSSKKETPVLR